MTSTNTIILIIILAVLAAIIDYLWLGFMAKDFYFNQLGKLGRPPGAQFDVRVLAAAGVYVLIALGIVFFVLPNSNDSNLKALLWGGLMGLLIYGVYELVNYAVLEGWSLKLVLIDIIWGVVFLGLLSVIGQYVRDLL